MLPSAHLNRGSRPALPSSRRALYCSTSIKVDEVYRRGMYRIVTMRAEVAPPASCASRLFCSRDADLRLASRIAELVASRSP
jgi:hypothetical protein